MENANNKRRESIYSVSQSTYDPHREQYGDWKHGFTVQGGIQGTFRTLQTEHGDSQREMEIQRDNVRYSLAYFGLTSNML